MRPNVQWVKKKKKDDDKSYQLVNNVISNCDNESSDVTSCKILRLRRRWPQLIDNKVCWQRIWNNWVLLFLSIRRCSCKETQTFTRVNILIVTFTFLLCDFFFFCSAVWIYILRWEDGIKKKKRWSQESIFVQARLKTLAASSFIYRWNGSVIAP